MNNGREDEAPLVQLDEARMSGQGSISDEEIDAVLESTPELDTLDGDEEVKLSLNGVDYSREEVRTLVLQVLRAERGMGKLPTGISRVGKAETRRMKCEERGCNTSLNSTRVEIRQGSTTVPVSHGLAHNLKHEKAKKLVVSPAPIGKKKAETVSPEKLLEVFFGNKKTKKKPASKKNASKKISAKKSPSKKSTLKKKTTKKTAKKRP